MADANIRINIDTSSLEELNTELGKLQAEIKKVPVGSAEFKKLSSEIRRVDGAVEGANKKLKSLDVGAVAGDVAKLGGAVASASALFKQFGAEGSKSQEAVQEALEATNVILGAGAIAEGVASAARLAGVAATRLATAAQAAYTAVVGTSTGALRAFRIALASTGIGLFVVGLLSLIENLDLFGKAAEDNAEKAEKAFEAYSRKIQLIGRNLEDEYKKQIKNATLAGQTDEQIEELRIKLLRERIAFVTEQNAKLALGETKQREELVKLQISYETELDSLEIQRYKRSEERRQKDLLKEEEAAKKRRDILKADIQSIIGLIQEVDRDTQLALLDVEQKTVLKGLENIRNSSKDLAQVLKELREEGQGPYADFIKTLVDGGAGIDEIYLKLEEVFARRKTGVISDFFESESVKLQESFDKLLEDLGVFETKYLQDLRRFTADFSKTIQSAFKNDPTALTSFTQSFTVGLGDISKKFDEISKEAVQFILDQEDSLQKLRSTGKITAEEFKRAQDALEKLAKEFDEKISKSRAETVQRFLDLSSSVVTSTISEAVAIAENEIVLLETKILKADTVNKAERLQIERRFQQQKATLLLAATTQEIFLLNDQIEDVKKLKDKGLITEQEAADKILEITRKLNLARKKQAELYNQSEVTAAEQRAQDAEDFLVLLDKIKFGYTLLSGAVQAYGNLLADQASIQDLRFAEEIEAIEARYQREFDLIDEREEKLEQDILARDTKIDAEERRRRALIKQRADLEKQQEAEIQAIEDQRANAAADAAIAQARINYTLAVGQIVISTAEAIAKSIAVSPQTFGLPFSAFAAAQGALQLAAANSAKNLAIAQAEASRPGVSGADSVRVRKGFAVGGLVTGPGNGTSDSVPTNLSNGEFVVNANSTSKFLPLLSAINQAGLEAGRPVTPSSFTDPQMLGLLQAIKIELEKPVRSYVVASDIEDVANKNAYLARRANIL